MKKTFGVIISFLLVFSLLAACSSKSATSEDKNTVTIWSWRDQDKDIWTKVQKELEAKGSKVKIKFRSVTSTQYDASLQTAMNGQQGPDILTLRAGAGISKYSDAKQVDALDNQVQGLKDFSAGTISQVSNKGHIYAVPFAVQTSQFFYNKQIFDKYHLSEPKTWDELLKTMDTLKKNGVTPMSVSGKEGWALNLIVDSVGATNLGDDWVSGLIKGQNKYSDPKYVDVLTKVNDLKKYFQNGFTAASYQDMETAFAQGQTAIILDGSWSVSVLLKQNPNLQIGSFMTPPVKEGDPEKIYAFVDGGYALNAASKNKKAALEVLNYTASKDYGQLYTDTFGEITAYPGITPSKPTEMLKKAMDNFSHNSINKLFRIRSPYDSGDLSISTVEASGLQEMLAGKKTPQELGDSIQSNMEKWYPAFKK